MITVWLKFHQVLIILIVSVENNHLSRLVEHFFPLELCNELQPISLIIILFFINKLLLLIIVGATQDILHRYYILWFFIVIRVSHLLVFIILSWVHNVLLSNCLAFDFFHVGIERVFFFILNRQGLGLFSGES